MTLGQVPTGTSPTWSAVTGPQLSVVVADAGSAAGTSLSHCTVTFAGQVITGGTSSSTWTTKKHVLLHGPSVTVTKSSNCVLHTLFALTQTEEPVAVVPPPQNVASPEIVHSNVGVPAAPVVSVTL